MSDFTTILNPFSIEVGSFANAFPQAPTWIQIGFFFLAWSVVWLPIAIPIARLVRWQPFKPLTLNQKLPLVASLYLLAPLLLWGTAQLERVPFAAFGLSWNLEMARSLSLGLGIGAIGILILFGIEFAFGWVRWRRENWRKWLTVSVPMLLLGLWIGVTEEWVFRGFFFGQLAPDGFWRAAIASSVVFAVLHLIWNGKEAVPQLPGLALMGVVLCFAVVESGQIGLASGLHAGWIWMLASLDASESLSYEAAAPEWGVGVDRQPLAGLLGLLLLLGTGLGLSAIGR